MDLLEKRGQTWNESREFLDPITLRGVRQVTTEGVYNNTMGYHTGIGWSGDGENLLLLMGRNGLSALVNCHLPSCDLKQITDGYPALAIGNRPGHCAGIYLHRRKAVFYYHQETRSARVVDIDTLEEETVATDLEQAGPVVADERHFLLPETGPGGPASVDEPYHRPYRFSRCSLSDGSKEVVYEGVGVAGHVQPSPVDPDLVLLDRNTPLYDYPKFGVTNRTWLLRISSGEMIELAPRNDNHAEWHATWRWDGKFVYYHGYNGGQANWVNPCRNGWYIGVIDTSGTVFREYASEGWLNYGHVGSLGASNKILLDGNITTDMVLALNYEDEERPHLEMVARHNTFWASNFGQMCHPHTTSSHDGKYIAFNALDRQRLGPNVFVVEY